MATKEKTKKFIISLIKFLILLVMTFTVIYPIIAVFFGSFKTKMEYLSTNSMTAPIDWRNLQNYIKVFTKGNVATGFLNTLFIIVLACFIATVLCTMVAFCLSRFEFRGKSLIDKFYLMASFVPGIIVHLIIFKDFAATGMINNLMSVVILYSGVDIVSLYLYKQYLNQIPIAIDESAMMEGCSYFRIYWSILIPMLKPAITTACIIKTTYIYNDFYTAFLYLPSDKKGVMSTVLYRFVGPYSSEWSVIAAGIIVVSLPVFIGFIVAQKYIYKGFSDGAVKG